jgi:CHASE3 domain sensor protein
MNIKTADIINIRESMGATPVETAQQEIEISLEELDNITTDEQKLALWQQISDAITAARGS